VALHGKPGSSSDAALITADAGGSNGYRVRAWKKELAALADETGLEITVCHYPPAPRSGTRSLHRMFSFISMNWRAVRSSPTDHRRVDRGTTTTKGLRIRAERDDGYYETGVKVSDEELAALPLTRHDFHGDWNYTLTPALHNQTCGEPYRQNRSRSCV